MLAACGGLEFVSHAVLKKDCCDPDAPAPTSNEQSAEQPPEGAVEAPPSKDPWAQQRTEEARIDCLRRQRHSLRGIAPNATSYDVKQQK
eukprot:2791033-Amphidinium_carterae.1